MVELPRLAGKVEVMVPLVAAELRGVLYVSTMFPPASTLAGIEATSVIAVAAAESVFVIFADVDFRFPIVVFIEERLPFRLVNWADSWYKPRKKEELSSVTLPLSRSSSMIELAQLTDFMATSYCLL